MAESVRVRVTVVVDVVTDADTFYESVNKKSERNQLRRNRARDRVYLALQGSSSISNPVITKCRLVQEGIEDDE